MALEKVGEMLNKKNIPHNNQDMIAYAAGLFDGEGNINYAQYNCKNLSEQVDQGKVEIIEDGFTGNTRVHITYEELKNES